MFRFTLIALQDSSTCDLESGVMIIEKITIDGAAWDSDRQCLCEMSQRNIPSYRFPDVKLFARKSIDGRGSYNPKQFSQVPMYIARVPATQNIQPNSNLIMFLTLKSELPEELTILQGASLFLQP